MKHTFHLITASTATLLACSAIAQNNTHTRPTHSGHSQTNGAWHSQPRPYGAAAKASDILGITVNNYQEEKLGKVEEIGVDLESGRILHVVISSGGVLGVGDRLTAVPPTALHHDAAQKVVHLESNKEKLKAAPEFDASRWVEHSDADHLKSVYQHHGRESELGFIHGDGVVMENSRTNRVYTPRTLPSGAVDPTRTPRPGVADTAGRQPIRNADGTWNRNDLAVGDRSMVPVARLAQVQKASTLVGMSVKNHQDETIGKVDNLLLDLTSGRIVAVVISSGGFLGMNGELSAVPPLALGFTEDRGALRLDTTKETLANAPHFKGDQWPDFNQPTYTSHIYKAHRVEPYFTRAEGVEPDNSRLNRRDRDGRSLTPLDQGNSTSDVSITARIRKEVTAGKGLSVNARNVKIITRDGQVTLRGPVSSAEEKRVIGEIADRIASPGTVDNQLEVTVTTSRN